MVQLNPGVEGAFIAVGGSLLSENSSGKKISSLKNLKTQNLKIRLENTDGYNVELKNDPETGLTIGTVDGSSDPQNKNVASQFVPASITKIVTTSLALKTLGAGFKFVTTVKWASASGGVATGLTILADGDPETSALARTGQYDDARQTLKSIAAQLVSQGITKVQGALNLIATDDRRDRALAPIGEDSTDLVDCYSAISQSFNYNENCASLSVTGLTTLRWSDANLNFPLQSALVSGTTTAVKPSPQFDALGSLVSYSITGKWAHGRTTPVSFALPINNVKQWYGAALLSELQNQGIDVDAISEVATPVGQEARQILNRLASANEFTVESDQLSDLVVLTNKPSNNFLADTWFKTMASQADPLEPDLRVVGRGLLAAAVQAWMQQNGTPQYASEIDLRDGAGLSKDNRVTPRAYLALLTQLTQESFFADLWNSLPIMGVDGTLKNRGKGTHAAGVVRGKTGTLTGAYQLVGYIPDLDDNGNATDYIPFVVLSSGKAADEAAVLRFQDAVVARLMDLVNPP